ncbi:MAG: universal stress protein [Pseudomonadota bacterium]|jgi:nucleotide-binding universal stress UspA family protein
MSQTMERAPVGAPARATTYATLLVHAQAGAGSKHRVQVAAALAQRLGARLVGLGAEGFSPIPTPDPFTGYASGEWTALVLEQIAKDLKAAEATFQRDAAGADVEWRSIQEFPARALVRTARVADLVVVSPRARADAAHSADPADVVMSAGRPVLLVPEPSGRLEASCVLVAWKNTRECRRAVADALPFLLQAKDVIVQAVCRPEEVEAAEAETADVVANLVRHGAPARALVTCVQPESVVDELMRVADLNGADLIVAGAYGHSRLREWVFGGVTDELMHRPGCYVLMSH